MTETLHRPRLSGTCAAIPSKSEVHRALIAAALSPGNTRIDCPCVSRDMEATAASLRALGCHVTYGDNAYQVSPSPRMLRLFPADFAADFAGKPLPTGEPIPILPVGESGSTLRFLLPVAALLCPMGVVFQMAGRLPKRPLSPLWEELEAHGLTLKFIDENKLFVNGNLHSGCFSLPGNVSSQFISGLLFALPLLKEPSELHITGTVESRGYIAMTEETLRNFGTMPQKSGWDYRFAPTEKAPFHSPFVCHVGGDYSNAAFFLSAGAIGQAPVTVTGLSPDTCQGDRRILSCLREFGAIVEETGDSVTVSPAPLTGCEIDASEIPDLVPVLSVVATAAAGVTRFTHAERLRMKESDRIATTVAMLRAVGADAEPTEDGFSVTGGHMLSGGNVNGSGDHRIVMSAAVLATLCQDEVTITGAEAVEKSYPDFFRDFHRLCH